tara:strand:+ start:302 stop:904 length:603 start_codon:yes stop_codon:yes gene_type:complete
MLSPIFYDHRFYEFICDSPRLYEHLNIENAGGGLVRSVRSVRSVHSVRSAASQSNPISKCDTSSLSEDELISGGKGADRPLTTADAVDTHPSYQNIDKNLLLSLFPLNNDIGNLNEMETRRTLNNVNQLPTANVEFIIINSIPRLLDKIDCLNSELNIYKNTAKNTQIWKNIIEKENEINKLSIENKLLKKSKNQHKSQV